MLDGALHLLTVGGQQWSTWPGNNYKILRVYNIKNQVEQSFPIKIKMVRQSLEDPGSLNHMMESLLEEKLPHVRIVWKWEFQILKFQQSQTIIGINNLCMKKPHPKLVKDSTAKTKITSKVRQWCPGGHLWLPYPNCSNGDLGHLNYCPQWED